MGENIEFEKIIQDEPEAEPEAVPEAQLPRKGTN